MVSSRATTVAAYLEELSAERRQVVCAVRDAIRESMPAGYEEAMDWGMITWRIPLARYAGTYNGRPLAYVSLAAQKNHYALYLMGIYGDAKQKKALLEAFRAMGRKPDLGKCCVRFRSLEEIPLAAIAGLVAAMGVEDYLARYEASRKPGARRAAGSRR